LQEIGQLLRHRDDAVKKKGEKRRRSDAMGHKNDSRETAFF